MDLKGCYAGAVSSLPSIWGWDVCNRRINLTQREGGEGRGLDKEIGRPGGRRTGMGREEKERKWR